MAFTKRQMMFVPEVNPASFVFFFEKGNSGTSWSIRDYSIANRVKVYRPGDFQRSADYFFENARFAFNAPAHDTNDLAFWHTYTLDLNQKHVLSAANVRSVPVSVVAAPLPASSFPVLNLEKLTLLPKGRKAQDMERILHSANSEDWVTWNFFQVLERKCPTDWWKRLSEQARRRNPSLDLAIGGEAIPSASFWALVHSPEIYLEASRRRMLVSQNPTWIARATASDPVEGPSEIDITIEQNNLLVFIEAKLGSDISMNTTYDPHRNQIIRNIDCLLDKAGHRASAFWMLVKDEDPSRAYVQLMNAYKADPDLLGRDLPHRSPESLERICRNLTTLLWSDFSAMVCGPDSDPQVAVVMRELEHRISSDALPKQSTRQLNSADE
jgi:hypothetical protein